MQHKEAKPIYKKPKLIRVSLVSATRQQLKPIQHNEHPLGKHGPSG